MPFRLMPGTGTMNAAQVQEWTSLFDKYGLFAGFAVGALWLVKWARPWVERMLEARIALQVQLTKESEARVLQSYQQTEALESISARLDGIESKLTSSPPTRQQRT